MPDRISKITNGKVIFDSKDLTKITEKEYQNIRGKRNRYDLSGTNDCIKPSFKIKEQIIEPIILHLKRIKRSISISKTVIRRRWYSKSRRSIK